MSHTEPNQVVERRIKGRLYHIVKGYPRRIGGVEREGYAVYDGQREVGFVFKAGSDWGYVKKFDVILHAGKTRHDAVGALVGRKR